MIADATNWTFKVFYAGKMTMKLPDVSCNLGVCIMCFISVTCNETTHIVPYDPTVFQVEGNDVPSSD